MRNVELNELIFNVLISRMRREGHCMGALTQTYTIKNLTKSVKSIFRKEGALINILSQKVIIVGDLHGNIDDLIKIFQKFQYPPEQTYLFLGDYVDRGNNSLEVLLLLFSLKIKYPNHIYLLRGNHESKLLTSSYGFKDECLTYLDLGAYKQFCGVFSHIPVAAVVNHSIFCVHGGLSPHIISLDQIALIKKPIRDIKKSTVAGLLWSDPYFDTSSNQRQISNNTNNRNLNENNNSINKNYYNNNTTNTNYDYNNQDNNHRNNNFVKNIDINKHSNNKDKNKKIIGSYRPSNRGIGFYFSQDDIDNFLESNNLKFLIRAHEFCKNGFSWCGGKCLTVFSSSDYNGEENSASVAIVTDEVVETVIFSSGPFELSSMSRVIIPEWIFPEQKAMRPPIDLFPLDFVADCDVSLV